MARNTRNRDVFHALLNFLDDSDQYDLPNLLKVQDILQRHNYISSNILVYRGTKVEENELEHIIHGEPFTLKATKKIRSWTIDGEIARTFMNEPPPGTIGLLLEDYTTYDDTIINLDVMRSSFINLLEWAMENESGIT